MEHREQEFKSIAEEYVDRANTKGVESVLSELESRVRSIVEPLVQFRNETLPRLIEQADQKALTLKKRWEGLMEDLGKVKQAQIEGWSRYYFYLTLFLWWAVVLGETLAFPWLYRDVFDLPLLVGVGFCALFPGASLYAKGVFYSDLNEAGKRRFRKGLFGVWAFSALAFTLSFLWARGIAQSNQAQTAALSLSATAPSDPLLFLRIGSFITLWLFGLTTAIGLAIMHAYYRDVDSRVGLLEKEVQATEEKMKEATDTYSDLMRELKEANSMVDNAVLIARNHLETLVIQRKEEMAMLQRMYPRVFQQTSPPTNGKPHTAPVGATLALVAALLAGSIPHARAQEIFMIQDVTRTSVEKDFQGFGKVVLGMPGGASLTLFGSDGVEYVHGSIEKDTYQGKEQRQRQALIGQGRPLYLRIKERPSDVRDYASAMAEVLPRMKGDAILILQGKPLYKMGSVSWDNRIPSLSWAFNPVSPFGEGALAPAPARFRAAVVFSPEDFVNPNHRAEVQHFWAVLLSRLNGDLALFTTDPEALPRLLAESGSPSSRSRVDLQIAPSERNASLRLDEVTLLEMAR